ncbi:MAG: C25 family cysteine peptidase [bacterium]|jgi:hypothetical protein
MKQRYILILLLVAGVGGLVTGSADAAAGAHIYNVPAPEMRETGEHVYYRIEGFGSSTNPYYPVLPTKTVHYEVPFAAENIDVMVSPGGAQSLGTFDNYLMRQPPLLLGDPTYKPPAKPEQLPDVTPAEFYRYDGVQVMRGHKLISVTLYPLRYDFASGEITYVSSYSIQVSYSMAVSDRESVEMAMGERSRAFEPLARGIIENYGEFDETLSAGGPAEPLYDLNNPQYAIITTSTFESAAQDLADWKTRKGVPTEVYLVSWIESNYTGYDTQEKIRNFLRLNNSTPRFDYVLLLGDTNTIPARYCWSQDGDDVPADYYFSDVVDGSIGSSYDWDTDNDHVWGEFSDTITWLPDTYVGRVASRNATEVQDYVDAIIEYETDPPVNSWPTKAVFGSAFANYPEAGYDHTDMAAVAEHVRTDFLNPAGVTYDRLYEADGIYPTSYTYDYALTATNFETRVGLGCGFAFPSGHGNPSGNYRLIWSWDDGDGYYDDGEGSWADLCTQSYNPSTGEEKPYVLVGACQAGWFDRTGACLGDYVIANWGIGCVASARNSYYCVGWDDPDWPWNQGQEYRWWEEIFSNGKIHMGQIHGDNKYNYASDFNTLYDGDYGPDNDYASRKNMFSSNLFGDPELPVWTDTPTALAASHDATLPVGPSSFTVTVTSGGSPLSGATVCLWKGTEVYLVDTTDGSGEVTFSPSPATTGTMYVTASKHNYIPDESSATVEEGGDTEDPVVTVTSPDGGETWGVGSAHDITWAATDNVGVTSIDILLSTDGGSTFPTTIATGEANDGTYPWTVPAEITTQARVKVIAYDAAANSGEDVSDADFEISDMTPPSVTVTDPNGGEVWGIGTVHNITWSATDNIGVTSVDLYLSTDGGSTFPTTIATGEANDGTYPWTVPSSPTTQARVKVVAHDAVGNPGEDISDNNFEIHDGIDPSVTVTSPNGGEVWDIGTVHSITWTATDNIGVTSIDIRLSTDGGATFPTVIATGEASDGSYPWTVPSSPTTQARVKVLAHDAAGNSGEDMSDANFTIRDGTDPSVTVLDPNGGEAWEVGSAHDIEWNATDNIGVTSIDILLSTDGGATFPTTVATGEVNDGTYPWTVPDEVTTQARIKVVAYDAGGNSGEDISDADLEIVDTSDPVVTVTSPNGGEVWDIGSIRSITWTATDNVGVTSIDIRLSTDGGVTYPTVVATGEDNDGVYPWNVPAVPTTQGRVKVIAHDGEGNTGEDVSNANFTIRDDTSPSVTVIEPNGGEIWDIGTIHDIEWNATDDVGVAHVMILLSSDGGLTYPDTLATGEANDGVYSWDVTQAATTAARIKVIADDAGNNSGEDISDADFEIYDPLAGTDITADIPASAVITGNSPNPFSGATAISFGIPRDGRVRLAMYDVSGREVDVLVDQAFPAGYHSVTWQDGGATGTGLYFIRLRFDSEEVTHKVVISR